MKFQLTERVIKLLCGPVSYEKGEACLRAKKVVFTVYDPDRAVYEASVEGTRTYRAAVRIDRDGDVDATCTCPAADASNRNCEHVAAVLLNIHDIEYEGRSPVRSYASLLQREGATEESSEPPGPRTDAEPAALSASDRTLLNGILGLFAGQPVRPSAAGTRFETRAVLEVQFICRPFPYGFRKTMLGLEMKLGPKQLYVVPRIRDFLESFGRRQTYSFSRHFTYDPELHSFRGADDAVIRQLLEMYRHEALFAETSGVLPKYAHGGAGSRMLPIPPASWKTLLPLLAEAPAAAFEQDGRTYDGVRLSDEPLPLRFAFDEAPHGGYRMEVEGLGELTVMEAYGLALSEGKLLPLKGENGKRLVELKQLLDSSHRRDLLISPELMEPFMDKVVPGLMKLGAVHIAEAVAGRLVRTPLKAKLYLDRVKDRLLAGLEFQYGDIVINPLEESARRRGEGRILMREGERERRILELMDQSGFVRTESGYFLDDEDTEYDFLHHTVPQLEKLVDIYATSAVKARLFTGHTPPKVRVEVDERTDWLDIRFDISGIRDADIRGLLKSLQDKRKYYRMPGGSLMPLDSAEFQEIVRFMNEVGIRQADIKGAQVRLPAVRALHLSEADKPGTAVALGKSLRLLLGRIRNPDHLDFPLPERLAPVLRDYQKYGFQWLKTLAYYGFGGILADDMGLGKTLQSIAFLVSVLPDIRSRKQPALIVCPASLVYNWRDELARFAPEVRTVIADGSRDERSAALHDAGQADAIITSYPLLRRDSAMYADQSFHTLILDEAQAFKNYATQTAQAVKSVQAGYRFALTGTPIENSPEELWSIFDAVFPGLFPGRKAFGELTREAVAKRARPFLLRRLKADVLKELPEKIESIQPSELLPEQKQLYVAYLAKLQQETLKHLNEDGFQKSRIKILAGLTRLRQLCCHPALFVEGYEGGSAKFEQLLDIVEECRNAGKRMLVFSQFTEMLGLIGRELGYRGVPYFYLDGQTPAAQRVELCRKFNEGDRELFLISLKAGGTGLNLTGADTVILYDLWWNPAVEQQAADRAHRIGQKNVVQVIRLVAQGTVEDKMYALQQKKKHMIDEVLGPGQEALSALTEQEIRDILMLA